MFVILKMLKAKEIKRSIFDLPKYFCSHLITQWGIRAGISLYFTNEKSLKEKKQLAKDLP